MWLHLRPAEHCWFKSHHVPTFSGVGIRKYTLFRPNIDHMPFCMAYRIFMGYGCNLMVGSKPTRCQLFSGVGIRKYTFFRPNIDHMRFCYALIRVITEGCWEITEGCWDDALSISYQHRCVIDTLSYQYFLSDLSIPYRCWYIIGIRYLIGIFALSIRSRYWYLIIDIEVVPYRYRIEAMLYWYFIDTLSITMSYSSIPYLSTAMTFWYLIDIDTLKILCFLLLYEYR